MTTSPTEHGPRVPSRSDIERVVAEKVRILRLIRALDRAGVAPDEIAPLRIPLVRLAEVDEMLTGILELLDREKARGAPLGNTLDKFLPVTEAVRGEVLDALDPRNQAAVRRAAEEVAATEAEIWLEVEGLRRRPPARSKPRRRGMLLEGEALAAAERAMASPGPPRVSGAAKVAAQEREQLPPEGAPIEAWLAWLPEPWRNATARLHDVPADVPDGERRTALARRLSDASGLERYLAERLGKSEREILATLLPAGRVDLGSRRTALDDTLAVHWDWEGGIPAAAGGRLRAAGFVFVGRRGRRRMAEVPPPLRGPLWEALQRADPAAMQSLDRARRFVRAGQLDGVPHDEPEHERWSGHDRAISRRFEEWAVEDPRTGEAFDAFFGDGPRVLRTEADTGALVEFALLDWRAGPGQPTIAERRLAEQPFRSAERQALAEAIVASRPALYRVGAVRRGSDLTLVPLFPAGAPVVATDRAGSLTTEVGWLVGARLYAAGPFTFFRLLGNPLPEREERALLRDLRRGQAAYAARTGVDDQAAFLLRDPLTLPRALSAREP